MRLLGNRKTTCQQGGALLRVEASDKRLRCSQAGGWRFTVADGRSRYRPGHVLIFSLNCRIYVKNVHRIESKGK